MGRVSFALADAAIEAGAVIAAGVTVAAVLPGEGVRLEAGELIRARAVVSNADPKRTVALCEHGVPDPFARRVADWRSVSPVLKINCALDRLPRFPAAREDAEPHRAMVTISTGVDATQAAYEASRRGEPDPAWCELYFQSAYDPSVVPAGRPRDENVFAQYVPYQLAQGIQDGRREAIADAAIRRGRAASPRAWPTLIEHRARCSAPPDIRGRMGLTGGHIFQGDCLAEQLWDRRFAPRLPPRRRLPVRCRHPPGRRCRSPSTGCAAMAVLRDLDG